MKKLDGSSYWDAISRIFPFLDQEKGAELARPDGDDGMDCDETAAAELLNIPLAEYKRVVQGKADQKK